MESPPSQGGFFMPETPPGTRFAKVVFPDWNGLGTGDEMGVLVSPRGGETRGCATT